MKCLNWRPPRASALSSTQRKRIERFSKLDAGSDVYTVAAYLIAQFGKNYAAGQNAIAGKELLALAMNHVRRAQDAAADRLPGCSARGGCGMIEGV